jgi:repressor LexA
MRTKDTSLMNRIVDYIDEQYSSNGRTPTFEDIAKDLDISKASVSNYIKEMAKRKIINLQNGSRGILTKNMEKTRNEVLQIPLVGTIACGTPMLAEENIERYVPISKALLGSGKFFILRASGNSMINANIEDGDYVIVKEQECAEEGQIIVALIENEATLKRYYIDKEKREVRLHPENSKMKDMYFKNIVIQGVAVKVLKDLV